jgi:LCP family protein required for cell wall assembly
MSKQCAVNRPCITSSIYAMKLRFDRFGARLLIVTGVALLLVMLAALRYVAAIDRNLAAIVVTPVPEFVASPVPLLVLPSVAPVPAAARVAPPTPAAQNKPAGVTVLILGLDQRPGTNTIPHTDAILLAHLEPATGRVALLSIPRDLWVEIPGYGTNRINNAYLWGEYYGTTGGGIALARATIGTLLDLPIDYVVLADFVGFTGLIDSIGGVRVVVEQALEDSQFPTDDYGTTYVHFPAGEQWLDGTAALTYGRIRHPDDDFERSQRQQQLLLAITEQLHRRGYLANLMSAERLTATLVGYVQTDMPREQIIELAWALRHVGPHDIERYALDATEVQFGVGADRYALVADPATLRRHTAELLGKPEPE